MIVSYFAQAVDEMEWNLPTDVQVGKVIEMV